MESGGERTREAYCSSRMWWDQMWLSSWKCILGLPQYSGVKQTPCVCCWTCQSCLGPPFPTGQVCLCHWLLLVKSDSPLPHWQILLFAIGTHQFINGLCLLVLNCTTEPSRLLTSNWYDHWSRSQFLPWVSYRPWWPEVSSAAALQNRHEVLPPSFCLLVIGILF